MKPALLSACSLLLCSIAHAQPDFSKVEMKTTHVAGNIYMLQGEGGNIGVSAGPDELLIVDDEFAPLPRINQGGANETLRSHRRQHF